MKKILLAAATLTMVSLPLFASAANVWSASNLPSPWQPSVLAGPLVTCTGDIAGIGSSPLPKCQDLCGLVLTVVVDIYIGMAFAIWIILPISFAVGGIMYMLGGANPGLLEKAKKTLWGAVIGTVIVLGSYLLIATFVKFIQIGYIGGFSPGSPSACTL